MNGDIKKNVTRRSIWLRLCFMIILGMAFNVAGFVTSVVVVFQFLSSLITGQPNDRLTRLGRNLAAYLRQITVYMTFGTEDIPFPFMPWPDEPHEPAPVEEDSDKADEQPEIAQDTAQDTADDGAANDEETVEEPAAEDAEQPDDKPEAADSTTGEMKAGDDGAADEMPPEEKPPEEKPAAAPQTAVFADSDAYQKFMGERSRLSGERFVNLLDLPPRLSWLDVGCGTGAFSAVIMENCEPAALIGIDSSEQQIAHAQADLGNAQASFRVGDATSLPFDVDTFDVAVSSYVLNFVPNKQKMMDEMARVVRPEGTVAISVFDVTGGRQASYPIWELIGRNDPAFREAEFEKRGWNMTNPEDLTAVFNNAGLEDVSVQSIEIDETYADFDEYWTAMTTMPTTGTSIYIKGLEEDALQKFKDDLKSLMPIDADGSINLITGSWLVRGKVPA